MECIFSANSLGNMFFDYIRSRKFALERDVSDQRRQRITCEQISTLCEHVALLLKSESKIIKCQAPAIICGDLRGSLESLLAMEIQLWRSMPVIADTLIFLGNYTGQSSRGSQAIEVLIYLLAIKFICPDKVLLLRGVQETREYNSNTLLPECKFRFGEELGKNLWEAFNVVFEQLPYMAIISESIVCVSSGCPKSSTKERLFRLLEDQDTLRQMLTNIPDLTNEQQGSMNRCNSREVIFKPQLLVPNAYFFSAGALYKFLNLNHFSYMLRSNEFVAQGYQTCFGRRCITIESNNCGTGDNRSQAAVAIVSHPRVSIQLSLVQY